MKILPTRLLIAALALMISACNTNNITTDDKLKQYFGAHQAQGCFALFDNGQGQFTIYNLYRYRDSAYLPAQSFYIFQSLVALGTGALFSDTVLLNATSSPDSEAVKPMNMKEAFAQGDFSFYKMLARRVGRDTLQRMLDSVGYGNKTIGASIDSFWLNNSLRITADEQLGFVKKLYFRQLPFQNREQDMVKNAMVREKTDKYSLAYATGQGVQPSGASLGWAVGWIEENQHPYFFVLNLNGPASSAQPDSLAMSIVKAILEDKGFFKGLK